MGYRLSIVVGNWEAEYIASGLDAIADCGEVGGQRSDCRGSPSFRAQPFNLCNLPSALYNSIMFPALIGLTAAAAASAAGYQSMAPSAQWFGRTFAAGIRGSKQIALTYDDGPNDPYTLKLMDVLARHDVRATFFLIGRHVQQRPDMVRDLMKAGHVVGNHT